MNSSATPSIRKSFFRLLCLVVIGLGIPRCMRGDVPRPERPRPDALRTNWLTLNGEWQFEIDPTADGGARGLASGQDLAAKIIVPFCPESDLFGFGFGNTNYFENCWYRRMLDLPAAMLGKRILLHFGAVGTGIAKKGIPGFHNRPFVWQIWDGRKDGFSALVNYHTLDHKLLEKLTYTYLGEWIKKQQDAVANEESGGDDRLLKARLLQDKLKLILEGEAPYDIFVRWKPLEQQPIGWHPYLNDGVRLNICPFMEVDVLRKRPNIKWGIDRGKNPPGSPWGEERDNDRHLTLAEKRKARES